MTNKKTYAVIYEHGKRNWSAYAPDLPGCIATGKTRKDVERRMREAMEFHIEGLREQGEPVPKPTTEVGAVSIRA
ncbi:MAG TPA: type II toxin-antitoxin system HicB family antitoxin [Phycisphaerae bacterium]|nr:type II toxin-antitoxin system HicB family antitoxin [Phycisphaerae bacterium]